VAAVWAVTKSFFLLVFRKRNVSYFHRLVGHTGQFGVKCFQVQALSVFKMEVFHFGKRVWNQGLAKVFSAEIQRNELGLELGR